MWQSRISLTAKFRREIRWFEEKLTRTEGARYEKFAGSNIVRFTVLYEEESVKQRLDESAAMLFMFFKFRTLRRALEGRRVTQERRALLSAVLAFEFETEKRRVTRILRRLRSYCVDGVCRFLVPDMLEDWEELRAALAYLCEETSDVAELREMTRSLTALRKTDGTVFIADPRDPLITVADGGGMLEVLPLYGDTAADMAAAVIAYGAEEALFGNRGDGELYELLRGICTVRTL